MATVSLFRFTLLLSFLHLSSAQIIINSSSLSASALDLPVNPSSQPTNQRWTTFYPSRGRSDVPVKVREGPVTPYVSPADLINEGLNEVHQGLRVPRPSDASFISGLSTQNLSRGPVLTRPTVSRPTVSRSTVSRPRTDTASLALISSYAKGGLPTKGLAPPWPTEPSSNDIESAGVGLVTASGPEEEPALQENHSDWQEVGSGSLPTVSLPTLGNEMAQFRLEAQTAVADGGLSKVADEKISPTVPQTEKPRLSALTAANRGTIFPPPKTSDTVSPVGTQATAGAVVLTGELTTNTSTKRSTPSQDPTTSFTTNTNSTSAASLPARNTVPGSTKQQPPTTGPLAATHTPLAVSQQPDATTHRGTTNTPTTTQDNGTILTTTASQPTKRHPGPATTQTTFKSVPGTTLTTTLPVGRGRAGPTHQISVVLRNRSFPLGHPLHASSTPASRPSPSPETIFSPNGTLLRWDDLSRTLSFAWELHVYGSAGLFLLLFAGAALGLTFSPGANCPLRGALALANALLFLAGGIRAAFFLIDPYGTRRILPRPAVIALYNLPLHLLVWAQAALALLALRVAGVSMLPSTLERPPLVAVLAVLQCTLLLATDLLSPALSPAVPVTLQVLSLCWGLVVCLGYLCYVFPRIRCPVVLHAGVPEEARRKVWTGSRKTGLVLGRVLALCGLLGALCCGLHVHATLWLYGLLGGWKYFNWGWWLVHFWARLLELAWGFSLLLLGSWVFWRPQESWRREEGGAGDGRAGGDLQSPGQSAGSTPRHTCWSKIVQSLTGKPCRKSESNGVGLGAGGGAAAAGELPNNWAGQERPGADISKSLIRNQNLEQAGAQSRCVKDSNRARNQRGCSAERGVSDGSTGSLLRLQALGRLPQRSASGSLDQENDTGVSLYEFDLRPPSPINLTRSIDMALNREHLLGGGSLFQSMSPPSLCLSQGSGMSQGPWLRRNSDPQMLSESSDAQTESSMPLGGSVLSSVPSRQVTAPPTPSHQGNRWAGDGLGSVPSSVSCPVSLRPSRTSTGHLGEECGDDTRPFITPDSERVRGKLGKQVGSRSYLEVSRQDDSASVSSEIIDL